MSKRLFGQILFVVASIALLAWTPGSLRRQSYPPPSPPVDRHMRMRELHWQGASPVAAEANTPASPGAIQAWNRIAFESYRDDNDGEIYLTDENGSLQTQLSNNNADDIQPSLRKDLSRIAFASNRDGSGYYHIFSMTLSGSGVVQLTSGSYDDVHPTWSPDGSKIAFESNRNGQWEVYVMNADGSGQTRLTNSSSYDGEPVWSPDGTQIAFTAYRNGAWRIWTMNANGSNQVQRSSQPYSNSPTWSPDGTRIAYSADNTGDSWFELWVMNANGTSQQLIFTPGIYEDAYAGSWSPDGQYLAFTRVHWVLIDQNWYWDWSYLVKREMASGILSYLGYYSTEWNPDWQADTSAPVTFVHALPSYSGSPIFVTWSGEDVGEARLMNYDVQVRDGAGGVWSDWMMATTSNGGYYPGVNGHTYYFRCRGRDYGGNLEAWPADYDAMTTVDTVAPYSQVEILPTYVKSPVTVRWEGWDTSGSGVASYDVQVRDGSGGTWSDWRVMTTSTSAAFSGTSGHTYYFRSRARDGVGLVESWPPGDGDTHTTIYQWEVSGNVETNAGGPIEGAAISTMPSALAAASSDEAGYYRVYVGDSAATYQVNVSKTGYGSLPAALLSGTSDAQFTAVLPPEDNLISNWGFESGSLGPDWNAGGIIAPAITNLQRHSGQYGAVLGDPSGANAAQTGTAWLSQTVTIPLTTPAPILSFLYQLGGASQVHDTLFAVQLDDGTSTTTLFTSTVNTTRWTHEWVDLSGWVGETITLTFQVDESAGQPSAWAYLDEVSLGAAHADLWVKKSSLPPGATPGETLIYRLEYGNRGALPASGVRITDTLPAEVVFVAASPAPATISPYLTWEIGDLGSWSGAYTVVVTTTVSLSATPFSTFNNEVEIEGTTVEVELANNQALAATFVGKKIYVPLVTRR